MEIRVIRGQKTNRMKRKTLNCNGKLVCIDQPMVMGIVNVAPDSFYDGGNYLTETDLLKRCEAIIAEGGGMIDIGAVSTSPGAQNVDAVEELRRLDWALACVRKHFPAEIISVDTYRADVAKAAVEHYSVDMINDISAGTLDTRMFETVATLNVPYVLTHIQGTPSTMQENPVYGNLMEELIAYFSSLVQRLRKLDVKDIIIDPGFGFGKTIAHNYEILRHLKKLEIFDLPIMVGVSRKSMIYKLLETDAQHALNGTTVVNTLALASGADILRVHDVKEAVECVKIITNYELQITDIEHEGTLRNVLKINYHIHPASKV